MAQENLINYINNVCRKKEHSLKWEVVGNEIEDFKVVINFKRHKKLNQNQLFKLKKAMSLDSKNQPKPKMGDEFPKILQERLELLETRVKRNSLDSTNLSQEISQLTSKIIKGDNKSIKGSPKSRKKNPFRRLEKGEKLSGRKGKLKFSLSVENLTFQSDIERRKEFLSIEKPSWLYEEDELQESPKSPRKTWMGKPDRNSKLSRSSFTEEKEQRPKSPTKPKSFKEIRSNKKRNEVERINKNNYKGQMRGKSDRKLKTREKRSKSLTDSTKEVEQIEKKIIASEITPPQSPSLQLKEEKRENNSGKQGPDIITYDELEQQERDISRRTDITTSISKNIPTLAESVNDIKKEEAEVTPTSASAIEIVTAGIEIDESGNELERLRTTNLKISKLKRQSRTLSREYSEESNSYLTSDNANIPVMTHSDNETEKARKKRVNSEKLKLEKKSPNDQSQFSNEEEILPVSKMLGKTGMYMLFLIIPLDSYLSVSLYHCTKKFSLRISSINVIKSVENCRLGHIY